ncbi:B3 domain-containing transcription factor VRN1-like [Arachis hypogaea]|uniref:B3 domain-containing transcription factor VRN1-like n=1 Tax=Arachis hypogaea TaxID=3818 RepID=UPI0011057524|nr:B3 domain-containing transcription factor VRN1-like isoform X2 [Arachis hypogaea]
MALQKIPNKFSRKYGGDMPNPVQLQPPDGTEWRIDWTNHDGEILFENGWKEFATFYTLENGHVLWFEYNGTSNIKVNIFDMSALEIDYPSNGRIGDDNSVEILDEPPARRGRGRPKKNVIAEPKQSRASTSTSKIMKSAIKTKDIDKNPNTKKLKQHVENEKDGQSEESADLKLPIIQRARPDMDVIREAKKFKSKNPSFVIKIKQMHQTGSPANLPVCFFRMYFENRKQWHATLIYYPNRKNALISNWRLFLEENNLKAGDVCIFELINRQGPDLKVHIRRSHD